MTTHLATRSSLMKLLRGLSLRCPQGRFFSDQPIATHIWRDSHDFAQMSFPHHRIPDGFVGARFCT